MPVDLTRRRAIGLVAGSIGAVAGSGLAASVAGRTALGALEDDTLLNELLERSDFRRDEVATLKGLIEAIVSVHFRKSAERAALDRGVEIGFTRLAAVADPELVKVADDATLELETAALRFGAILGFGLGFALERAVDGLLNDDDDARLIRLFGDRWLLRACAVARAVERGA